MRFNKGLLLVTLALLCEFASASESIAYLREKDSVWQVWVYDLASQNHQQLTDGEFDKTRISWNKTRDQLLVNRNNGSLFWLNLESKEITEIEIPVEGILDAKLSYDDQWIAYSDIKYAPKPNYNIWRIKADGSATEQLTNQSDLQNFPAWSPDDASVMYISGSSTGGRNIWQLDVKTKSQAQATSHSGYSFDPVLNQQGDLAYSANEFGNYDIWVKKHDQKDAMRITTSDDLEGAPSWSIDGSQIVYEVLRGSNRQLWIMNRDGSKATPITPPNTASRSPAWAK